MKTIILIIITAIISYSSFSQEYKRPFDKNSFNEFYKYLMIDKSIDGVFTKYLVYHMNKMGYEAKYTLDYLNTINNNQQHRDTVFKALYNLYPKDRNQIYIGMINMGMTEIDAGNITGYIFQMYKKEN